MRNLFAICISVLTYFSSYAQDPQLFENDWYLQKVLIGGQNHFPPNLIIEPQNGRIVFIENEENIDIAYCDIAGPVINYDITESIFHLQDDPIILAGLCSHQENISFAAKYFSIFYDIQIAINPFNYTFTDESGIVILTIINSLGNQAIYTNELLTIQDYDNLSFNIYPNPVKHELFITSKSDLNDFNIFIYSIDGKLILEVNNSELSNKSINVQKLTNGIYFILIKNYQGQSEIMKFIKN